MASYSPFGLQPPPQEDDEYGQSSPLGQAGMMGLASPPSNGMEMGPLPGSAAQGPPNYQDQINAASSTPGMDKVASAPLLGGAQKGPSKASRWLDTLAPILAGAAAIMGYKKDSAFGDALMGVGQGYATHLTDVAKEKRDTEHESNVKTVDLAHKYLASMPGDVDPSKYPRLAEMGNKMRESLVNGKLSNPKEAQDFILEYTKYKHDIDEFNDDQAAEDEKRKAMAPYNAFQQSFADAGIPQEQTGSALLRHYGGLVMDPKTQTLVDPTTIAARTRAEAMAASSTAHSADVAATNESRLKATNAGIAARHADVATRESGANTRNSERIKSRGGMSGKEYDTAFKSATNAAIQRAKQSPPTGSASPAQHDMWVHDYLIQSGMDRQPLTREVKGKTYYYIGNDKWDDKPPKVKNSMSMTPPPFSPPQEESDAFEDEDDGF